MLAMAYAAMNNKDEALCWLQKAYSEHSHVVNTLKVDPVYDPLRSDPRFQALLRGAGLAHQPAPRVTPPAQPLSKIKALCL